MKDVLAKVLVFHQTFGLPIADAPGFVSEFSATRRGKMLTEEYLEYIVAEKTGDLVGIADAIADLIYVLAGSALVYGIPLEEVFDEVHRSNMSKLWPDGRPRLNADGKILKGPNFFAPGISSILSARQKHSKDAGR